jgi:hypothetical protein
MKRVEATWVAAIVFVVLLVIGFLALTSGASTETALVQHGVQSVTICGVKHPNRVFEHRTRVLGAWISGPGPAGCVTLQQLSSSGLD